MKEACNAQRLQSIRESQTFDQAQRYICLNRSPISNVFIEKFQAMVGHCLTLLLLDWDVYDIGQVTTAIPTPSVKHSRPKERQRQTSKLRAYLDVCCSQNWKEGFSLQGFGRNARNNNLIEDIRGTACTVSQAANRYTRGQSASCLLRRQQCRYN